MKKYLIVSDSHGHNATMREVIKKVSPIDGLFHCGDMSMSASDLREMAGCQVWCVKGNNDYFEPGLEKNTTAQIGTHKVALAHGHQYGVYSGVDRLVYWAKEEGADVVMYGHTHVPELVEVYGITVINPGSISLPRQYGHKCTFAIMELDDNGELHFTIKELD